MPPVGRVRERLQDQQRLRGSRRGSRRRGCTTPPSRASTPRCRPGPARRRSPPAAAGATGTRSARTGSGRPASTVNSRDRASCSSPCTSTGVRKQSASGTGHGHRVRRRPGAPTARCGRSRTGSRAPSRSGPRPCSPSTIRTMSGASPRGGMKSITRTDAVGRLVHGLEDQRVVPVAAASTARIVAGGRELPPPVIGRRRAAPRSTRRSRSAGSSTSRSTPRGSPAPRSAGRRSARSPRCGAPGCLARWAAEASAAL